MLLGLILRRVRVVRSKACHILRLVKLVLHLDAWNILQAQIAKIILMEFSELRRRHSVINSKSLLQLSIKRVIFLYRISELIANDDPT